jgi:hypothetical protein
VADVRANILLYYPPPPATNHVESQRHDTTAFSVWQGPCILIPTRFLASSQHNKKKLARAAAREQELKKLKAQRETVSSSLSAVRAKLESVEKEVHALKQGLVQNGTLIAAPSSPHSAAKPNLAC